MRLTYHSCNYVTGPIGKISEPDGNAACPSLLTKLAAAVRRTMRVNE